MNTSDTASPPLSIAPHDALAAGEIALQGGRYAEAARLFEAAAAMMPPSLSVARMVAGAWQLAGRRALARRALLSVMTPPIPPSHGASTGFPGVLTPSEVHELGTQLLDIGAPAEALECFTHVARILPGHPAVLGALASAHRALGNLDEAWDKVREATAADRSSATMWLTAAQVRHAQGHLDDALRFLRKAEVLRPFHSPTRLQRGFTRLLREPSSQGWADFEHRGLPALPSGRAWWQGESLEGKSVLVAFEQGIGDMFHFLRYVPLLSEQYRAAHVVVEAPTSAVTLLRSSGLDAFEVGGAPSTDLAVPILSLPFHLGSNRDKLGDRTPYLFAGNAPSRRRDRSSGLSVHRKIGLVARGNPDFPATNLRDIDNSVASSIAGIPEIEWVWLQLGEDLPLTGPGIEAPELSGDWLDTARLLSTLDGLVSVDTGLAHLAGAMGVPVWIMLPFSPDWRWGLRSESTGWYPSATLIRQPAPRDWPGAVDHLRQLLSCSE